MRITNEEGKYIIDKYQKYTAKSVEADSKVMAILGKVL